MGQNGSVAYLFERKGVFHVSAESQDELELFDLVVDAGAEDLISVDDMFVVTAPVESFGSVQSALEGAGITPEEAVLERVPVTTTSLNIDAAQKVIALTEKMEDHADVQAVFTTLEFDDTLLAALS